MQRQADPLYTDVTCVLDFLYKIFDSGLSYSMVNTARSALSSFVTLSDGATLGTHPLVSRFLKGVFNTRTPKPRYHSIWDARLVLNYLRSLSPMKYLSLKNLTIKLVMLLSLLTAQRCQTIHKLRIDKMIIKGNSVVFHIDELLKTSRPGNVGQEIKMESYPPDRRLCIKTLLSHYIERTKLVRGNENQLLLSYVKPHGKVSKDTIARWIRICLAASGIDINIFKAHSVRAASVSAARAYVPVSQILSKAGWTNEKTFQKFYDKPILKDNFARKILDAT